MRDRRARVQLALENIPSKPAQPRRRPAPGCAVSGIETIANDIANASRRVVTRACDRGTVRITAKSPKVVRHARGCVHHHQVPIATCGWEKSPGRRDVWHGILIVAAIPMKIIEGRRSMRSISVLNRIVVTASVCIDVHNQRRYPGVAGNVRIGTGRRSIKIKSGGRSKRCEPGTTDLQRLSPGGGAEEGQRLPARKTKARNVGVSWNVPPGTHPACNLRPSLPIPQLGPPARR